MRNKLNGNTSIEYLICLTFVFIILVGPLLLGNGIFGDKSIFLIFKNAYELFMNKFNATILNMDAIP
ncbi:hypothetical protein F959_01154 [Acinetobacter venetianus RAG-1 = CIP 110063]|uniref:Uncharacterized protein n=1 Tax=Acinetobacter venetianus (strain ATCC 31012 / DSM 23050 / BCRC 14357 / CCUG 45561 / CIP 110063 / KCTC 2702 / LMG 19082 / RAG-1) TaxID=1191460 RepID=N8YLE0_ACIVR|nr:hypothetical protein F959_01154 [Acinetobacter venetianus RAG-1 = CIP 110063]